jgi:hypothetical protein
MRERSGPFWDAMRGRAPLPGAAATLGMEFIDAGGEAGTIQLRFAATEAFTNPTGNVLGDGDLVFLEASLADPEAVVVATATATARVIALRDASAAA